MFRYLYLPFNCIDWLILGIYHEKKIKSFFDFLFETIILHIKYFWTHRANRVVSLSRFFSLHEIHTYIKSKRGRRQQRASTTTIAIAIHQQRTKRNGKHSLLFTSATYWTLYKKRWLCSFAFQFRSIQIHTCSRSRKRAETTADDENERNEK